MSDKYSKIANNSNLNKDRLLCGYRYIWYDGEIKGLCGLPKNHIEVFHKDLGGYGSIFDDNQEDREEDNKKIELYVDYRIAALTRREERIKVEAQIEELHLEFERFKDYGKGLPPGFQPRMNTLQRQLKAPATSTDHV